ncbi:MAG: D-alanine--D-alanine ligase [Ruminococcaceae bacterium]|nr:D-alanine--D-alanine ligase [Oscillospiraceae bacterium]
MKIKLAVLFGGMSVEHEVSVISALQAVASLDTSKYDIYPIYMTKNNEFYTGPDAGFIESYRDIPALLKKCTRCFFIKDGNKVKLMRYPLKRFGNNVLTEVDVAFPIVHGTNVEDGVLQGYLKTLGLPFVGCDVLSSAVGMDKYVMKTVLMQCGVPVLDCIRVNVREFADPDKILDECEAKIGYPVIVKPVNLGSSVGISLAKDRRALLHSLDDAFRYAPQLLIERAVTDLTEINCSVCGDVDYAEASECEQPLKTDEILSYADKYTSGGGGGAKGGKLGANGGKLGGAKGSGSKGAGMASLSRKIPADISPERREEIRTMAVKAFQALGCNGVSRIDFMIDGATDKVYLNEINTIPGSLSFYLWKPVGVEYNVLLDRMIELALKRRRQEESFTYSFDTNILAVDRSFTSTGGSKGGKLGTKG